MNWDVKSWHTALQFWDKNIDWTTIHNCIELGGRAGGLSLWLAMKGKHVICSDFQQTEITAKSLHEKYRVTSQIKYQDIDATNIPYKNAFDIIVFKSILGGIGRNNNINKQQRVIDESFKALKKGGKLLFAENLIASRLHRQFRKQFVSWGDSWRYVSLNEMKMFLQKFSSVDIDTTGVAATFGRNESQRKMLATVDKMFLNRISPDSWKYITFGIATK